MRRFLAFYLSRWILSLWKGVRRVGYQLDRQGWEEGYWRGRPKVTDMRPLDLTWCDNRRDGEAHVEWHAPCGCAYHPEPKPHVHPCAEHQ